MKTQIVELHLQKYCRDPGICISNKIPAEVMLLAGGSYFSNHPSKLIGEFPFPSWSGSVILTCFKLFFQEQNPGCGVGSSSVLGHGPGTHYEGVIL